jgi:hypothetical protein
MKNPVNSVRKKGWFESAMCVLSSGGPGCFVASSMSSIEDAQPEPVVCSCQRKKKKNQSCVNQSQLSTVHALDAA